MSIAEVGRQPEEHPGRPVLPGPAPVRNQVRAVTVRLEALPEGLRISTPTTPGWAAIARTPEQLAAALRAAFTEAQLASYAAWRGHRYDLSELNSADDPDPLVAAPAARTVRKTVRRDQYDPADWEIESDGCWRSPSGRRYKPDSAMVARVRAARRRAGLT